ncbi:hypothetical protein H5410_000513 [Solanum commersonii]|uniref:Uncharacterized protein n=1 Tax=Solanum commersonii TaxID=4109 RepID=A0A9J6AWF8_SOLCO|nr:hypothetical protein H5410_000513 [Solanum commersonii]
MRGILHTENIEENLKSKKLNNGFGSRLVTSARSGDGQALGHSKVYKDLRTFRGLALKDLRIFNKALLGNYGDSRQRAGFMEGCESRKSMRYEWVMEDLKHHVTLRSRTMEKHQSSQSYTMKKHPGFQTYQIKPEPTETLRKGLAKFPNTEELKWSNRKEEGVNATTTTLMKEKEIININDTSNTQNEVLQRSQWEILKRGI